MEQRAQRILPTHYFHVVFTLPQQLKPLARDNPKFMFNLLFRAASRTLLEFGQSRLEAQLAFTAVLHTWTRKLLFHPHLHCIVSGGGLNHPQQLWNAANPRFLFPVKAMSRLFRSKFLDALRLAYDQDELELSANASPCCAKTRSTGNVTSEQLTRRGRWVLLQPLSRATPSCPKIRMEPES